MDLLNSKKLKSGRSVEAMDTTLQEMVQQFARSLLELFVELRLSVLIKLLDVILILLF